MPIASYYFTPLIYAISITSLIYSSLSTLRQIDLKKIIAYSSIGHMAVVNIGLFSNNITGISGGLLLSFAHGIVSPALFLLVTFLYDRYHTRIINYFRGLNYFMPIYSLFLFLFVLANMATPLTGNFNGELLSFSGS
jgi:NADH-ubiquinone oxidoreductase chain 4